MAEVRPLAEIASYHAHVYFSGDEQARAARRLRERVAERFAVRLGTWHERAVGPHDRPMFQIAFPPDLFGTVVPWLMLNRDGLSVLVHPNTTNPKRDHVTDRLWMGEALALEEEVLAERDDHPEAVGELNTEPTISP